MTGLPMVEDSRALTFGAAELRARVEHVVGLPRPRRKAMEGLPMRELGRTGLQVTTLGYGAAEFRGAARGAPDLSDDDAARILNAVLDLGINFIDTSPDYGRSEEVIGKS